MSRTEGRILVIRGGAIGDFILTLPVLAALRQQFPDTHLEVLGYAHIAQLALAGGLADAVRSIEARPLAAFFASGGELAEDWRQYFARFAVVVSFLYDPDQIFEANVARCSRAQFIAGPHRPDERAGIHATEVFLKPLERLAILDADSTPRLALPAPAAAPPPPPPPAPRLAFHPGSGSERKNWPETSWADLLRHLAETTDWHFLLVGGEAEGTRLDRLAACLPAKRLEIARHLPLPELAARLRNCRGYLGHDSGITHLAAALDLPACVLWGDSVEAVWRPRGSAVHLLHEPAGLAALPVLRVGELLQRVLETS